ncbi:hypothetical protein [Chitinolyticbacter meiyuanensis]|uniref:hypothetical protein n=1 Tax=Chitinolyticbacter meiyuanensis TaxID=682798 RepID=UPI0011E5FB6E|nr:hypothetical protein [Chitinolyticbacter meiyuanensis]
MARSEWHTVFALGLTVVLSLVRAEGSHAAEVVDDRTIAYLAQDIVPCITSSSPPRGACIDAAALLAEQTGLPIRVKILPQIRVVREIRLAQRQITIAVPETMISTGSTSVRVIAKIGHLSTYLLPGRHLDPAHIAESAAWKGKTIAVIRGGCPALSGPLKNALAMHVAEASQALKMIQRKRVDGLCINGQALANVIRRPGFSWQDFGPPVVVEQRELWLLASSGITQNVETQLHDASAKLVADGAFRRLLASYMQSMPTPLQLR